jgi:hypothetical protein
MSKVINEQISIPYIDFTNSVYFFFFKLNSQYAPLQYVILHAIVILHFYR